MRILILLVLAVGLCQCHNILVIFPHIGKSHFLAFENLFKTLATKEHNVTVISFFPQKNPIPNYRDVAIDSASLEIGTGVGVLSSDMLNSPRYEMYSGAFLGARFADLTCPVVLSDPNLHNFLKENNKFDVVLVEIFNTNCHLGIAKKFEAPIIGLASSVPVPWVAPMFGLPDNPSYIPSLLLDHNDQMSFLERVENSVFLVFYKLVYEFMMRRPGIGYSKKYIGEDPTTLEHNISLLLVSSHFSASRPRPIVPNVIEVAGIHIGDAKPLPSELEKYITDSEHGVIYMSMGSVLQGSSLPKDKVKNFLKVFSKLPQNIIWKYESETLEGKPANVKLMKWTPQKDLLCHPNVKAFISHGGIGGTLEGIHCGVPMIVIPHFGDQFSNAAFLKANGHGISMLMSEATEATISEKLKKVLNSDFKKQAKRNSEVFKDRPHTPMESALYWIDYVIRYRGASFIRTAAVEMPAYKYYLFDVICFLIIMLVILVFAIYKLFSFVFGSIRGKKTKLKIH